MFYNHLVTYPDSLVLLVPSCSLVVYQVIHPQGDIAGFHETITYLQQYLLHTLLCPRRLPAGILSSLSCPSLKRHLHGASENSKRGASRSAAVPVVTRLRASSRGRPEALPPYTIALAPADLDVLAQKHGQAQVGCFPLFLFEADCDCSEIYPMVRRQGIKRVPLRASLSAPHGRALTYPLYK